MKLQNILFFTLTLLAACADPARDTASDLDAEMDVPDEAADLSSSADLDAGDDLADDLAPDLADPCRGITCGDDGRCVARLNAPACDCAPGFVEEALRCVRAPAAPSLENLPATQAGPVRIANSFQLTSSDPNADALTFTLDDAACPLDVTVDLAGRVSWTCPATSVACELPVTVTDPGGLSQTKTLSIACVNAPPTFTSALPAQAAEGDTLRYTVACADPDGAATTLSVAPEDTCGGVLEGDIYVLTPTETQGGTSCQLHLRCDDGEATTSQHSALPVAETYTAPQLLNLPAAATAPRSQAGAAQILAADADLPAQPLSFSLTTTCAHPVAIDASTGLLTFTCGPDAQRCQAEVSVSDGVDSAAAPLTIDCINSPPSASPPTLAPAPTAAGDPLTCAYTFSDPDGDPDLSQIEWLVDGVVTASGPSFAGYWPGESIACRVTPQDGMIAGATVASQPVRAPGPTIIAASASSTCVAKDGALSCWGNNLHSQLGASLHRATDNPVTTPQPVFTSGVSALDADETNTCAIHQGALKCWGSNAQGQLASPSSLRSTHTPQTLIAAGVTDFAIGSDHICAVVSGALTCIGANHDGQIGVAGASLLYRTFMTAIPSGVTAVSAGGDVTCAIHAGALKCWGDNGHGQLGVSYNTTPSTHVHQTIFPSGVTAVRVGQRHTCAIHAGELKCWGNNVSGQLGVAPPSTHVPQTVALTAVSDLALGDAFTCARSQGALMCWGDNSQGQLSLPAYGSTHIPQQVFASDVTAIAAGARHACAVQLGELKCWGSNEQGQLAQVWAAISAPPLEVTAQHTSKIALGRLHSCAIHQGALYCWGSDQAGQLGTPSSPADGSPAQIFAADTSDVALGQDHTCAIHQGALKCWGRNTWGQLGLPSSASASTPQTILPADVTTIAAGGAHTCAILASGALQCWGRNTWGQLGAQAHQTAQHTPHSVINADVAAVAAGDAHTCAILASGALQCWGDNARGQLGVPMLAHTHIPQQVFASDVAAVSAGAQHTCAIHQGALYCWGSNALGQLGTMTQLGTTTPTPPQQVFASGVTAVAAGAQHTCAVVAGALHCWGYNENAQLGVPLATQATLYNPLPIPQVIVPADVTSVSAGLAHTCFIHDDLLKCMGLNSASQLGRSASRFPPMLVTLP